MLFGYVEGKSNCTDPEHRPRSVVTAIFYCRIKHDSFPSLCIGENHRIVLECYIQQQPQQHLLDDSITKASI